MCWLDRILQDKWACRLWFVISHVLTICKVREKHRWCCFTRSYGLGHFNCSFTFFKVNDEWVNWLRHLYLSRKKQSTAQQYESYFVFNTLINLRIEKKIILVKRVKTKLCNYLFFQYAIRFPKNSERHLESLT